MTLLWFPLVLFLSVPVLVPVSPSGDGCSCAIRPSELGVGGIYEDGYAGEPTTNEHYAHGHTDQ